MRTGTLRVVLGGEVRDRYVLGWNDAIRVAPDACDPVRVALHLLALVGRDKGLRVGQGLETLGRLGGRTVLRPFSSVISATSGFGELTQRLSETVRPTGLPRTGGEPQVPR